VKVRLLRQKALWATERCGIEKPAASQEAIAQTIKREPIVPIGSAGMVRRRVTSSVKRRGTVVPLLCSISSRHEFAKGHGVGRGEGQGYFAYDAGGRGFESHLVHATLKRIALEPAGHSSEVEHPMFPDVWSVQQFSKGARRSENTARDRFIVFNLEVDSNFLNSGTFRLHGQS